MNKKILNSFLILLFTILLTACSEEVSEELQVKEIIKPQLEAMEKAKAVEGLLQDAANRRHQDLQQQEQ